MCGGNDLTGAENENTNFESIICSSLHFESFNFLILQQNLWVSVRDSVSSMEFLMQVQSVR